MKETSQRDASLYRSTVEAAPIAMLLVNSKGNIVVSNPQAETFFRYEREELIGQPIENLVPERFRSSHRQYCSNYFAQPETRVMGAGRDLYGLCKDGTEISVEIGLSPVLTAEGTLVLSTIIDISERKQLESKLRERLELELRETEARFRTLVETVPAAIFIWRGNRFSTVNSAMASITGYSIQELQGMDFWEVIPPDCREFVKQRGQARLRGEVVPPRYETKILRKDGDERWVDLTANLIELDGEPAVLGAGFDITERKQADEELQNAQHELEQRVAERTHQLQTSQEVLRENVEQTRLIIESAQEAFISMDARGEIVDWNSKAETTFGWTKKEICGRSLAETIVPPQHREDHLKGLQHFLETGSGPALNKRLEMTALLRNGQEIPVELTITPARQGQTHVFHAFLHDISDRKQAEQALQESEAKYRDLFENAGDLIQSIAPDGSFIYVNPSWKQALGYNDQETGDLSVFDIIHPDSQAHCQQLFQRVMAGEKLEHIEAKFLTKDGQTIVVEGSSSCKFENGKPVATRGIFRDVTERKLIEKRLRQQTEELKIANAELERFNRLAVGREQRMIELKLLVNELSKELGREAPYNVSFRGK